MHNVYNSEFYLNEGESSSRSAETIVGLVYSLVHPHTVVDVGCGIGAFLSEFKSLGVKEFLGIDGDWVDLDSLIIDSKNFMKWDVCQELNIERKFELVVSLETAEHLPETCAETFIDNLVKLGDVILFSAAIPFQGGAHHVNLQWPGYWSRLFKKRGYVFVDMIRMALWNDKNVDYHYAQNSIIYVKETEMRRYPLLLEAYNKEIEEPFSLVHPNRYLREIASLEKYRKFVPAKLRKILHHFIK